MIELTAIAVFSEKESWPRLLVDLARALPLRLETWNPGDAPPANGLIVLDGDPEAPPRVPILRYAKPLEPVHGAVAEVTLRSGTGLWSFEGELVYETAAYQGAPERLPGRELARVGEQVCWTVDEAGTHPCYWTRIHPVEPRFDRTMEEGHPYRRASLAVLPLLHFLRRYAVAQYTLPAPMACFMVDDPNLRRFSYGYLDYQRLVDKATRHGYHLCLASIPLDFRGSDPAVVDFFQTHPEAVSVCLHGNDHARSELDRLETTDAARRLLAQVSTRRDALEAETGLQVAPVMVPPHGSFSPALSKAFAETELEGICTAYRGVSTNPLAGPVALCPTSVTVHGTTVLPRGNVDDDESCYLRAALGQPHIHYFHHQDFKEGLGILAEQAGKFSRISGMQWKSPEAILRGCFTTWTDDAGLVLALHARHVVFHPAEALSDCRVLWPCDHDFARPPELEMDGTKQEMARGPGGWMARAGALDQKPHRLRIIVPHEAEAPEAPATSWTLRMRRCLTERRDRMEPAINRLGLEPVVQYINRIFQRLKA